MIEQGTTSSIKDLVHERQRLVAITEEYEPMLSESSVSSDLIQEAIEELRAIRMRIHAIDRQLAGQDITGG
jgi:hypothetical protein